MDIQSILITIFLFPIIFVIGDIVFEFMIRSAICGFILLICPWAYILSVISPKIYDYYYKFMSDAFNLLINDTNFLFIIIIDNIYLLNEYRKAYKEYKLKEREND